MNLQLGRGLAALALMGRVCLALLVLSTCLQVRCGKVCTTEQPKLQLDLSQVNATDVVNRGSDFIDLIAGSNLTVVCEGKLHMVNSSAMQHKQIEWILPEFHPVSNEQCH